MIRDGSMLITLNDVSDSYQLLECIVRDNKCDEVFLISTLEFLQANKWRGWNISSLRRFLVRYILCYCFRSEMYERVVELLFSVAIGESCFSDDGKCLAYFVQFGKALCVDFVEELLQSAFKETVVWDDDVQLSPTQSSNRVKIMRADPKRLRIGDVLHFVPSDVTGIANNTDIGLIGVVSSCGEEMIVKVQNAVFREFVVKSYRVVKRGNCTTFKRAFKALESLVCNNQRLPAAQAILQAHLSNDCTNTTTSDRLESEDGLNEAQTRAVKAAVSEDGPPVVLIQGPPGCGKTRVVVSILRSLVIKVGVGKVLAAASTNKAVDNILELLIKMKEIEPSVIRVGDVDSVDHRLGQYHVERKVDCFDKKAMSKKKQQQEMRKLIKNSSVVCSTVVGAALKDLKTSTFEYVVIDEAAQLTEPCSLIPIIKASKRVILVGDHKQLGPVVTLSGSTMKLDVSLFERIARNFRIWLLDHQYRMHPAISQFPSIYFYGGSLRDGVSLEDRPVPTGFAWPNPRLGPVAFVNVDGQEQNGREEGGKSKKNVAEATKVVDIVTSLCSCSEKGQTLRHSDIGVITPYLAQANLVKEMLLKVKLPLVEVGTVDSFQGREKEVILVTTCRTGTSVGFLKDRRRMNVAITRPRSGLIVVGREKTLAKDDSWKAWLDWLAESKTRKDML
eukprot:TRINITY_DN2762_c0_g2_i2.p1 TRINITY_DN2762_c0_g2~~TRINITY_DN2762_c0_g2_i2.p1  ORF type:complete len:674 (+),score=125.24 TRINITY_DN2762_c0_g2_i2:114-2135(+)